MNHAATFVVADHARASQHTREPRLTPHAHMQPELQAVILASCSDLYTRSSARTHLGKTTQYIQQRTVCSEVRTHELVALVAIVALVSGRGHRARHHRRADLGAALAGPA